MENDPFKEYYDATFKVEADDKGQEATSSPKDDPKNIIEAGKDALIIKGPITKYIQDMNAIIGKVFDNEKAKGTRPDLIITLVIGGLAFTIANLFYLITKNLGSSMTADEYERTYMEMYRSAMRDIAKNEDK